MVQYRIRAAALLLAGVGAMALAQPAFAQEEQTASPEAAPPEQLRPDTANDIIVTAQKRSERLQDVPLAVTAVTGDALANRQIDDSSSLVAAVPSLSFQQGNNPTNTSFRIRGVGTSLFGQGVESSVSVVVDGVVAARQAQSFTDFADIERVEVLRGPQGTLFGKNATAGVINIVTERPSRNFEARGNFTIAEGDEYRASGTVSGPISNSLRARLTGYYNDVGGYLHNLKTGKDDNGFKSWGVRGKLDWDATDNLNFLLAADYRKNDSNCCQGILVKANDPDRLVVSGPIEVKPDSNQVWNNGLTFANTKQQTISLQGDLDLGAASITSITAYQHFYLDNNFEVDRFGYDVPIFIDSSASSLFDLNHGTTNIKNFTQELRIASSGSRRFTYVAGVFYSHLWIGRFFERRRALCASGTLGEPCADPTYQSLSSYSTLVDDNVAGFGQIEWEFVPKLKAIGGIRVQYEKVSVTGQRFGPLVSGDGLFGPPAGDKATRSADDTAVTGKAGLQYQFNRNAQIYASYTRGYKGLGFDTEISADFAHQNPVLPEHVNAYEAGFKGQALDGAFSIAVAAFLADYTNLQVQANRTNPATGVPNFVQTNAGSSQTKGFEIEATIRPSDSFSVNTALTYARSRIDIDGLNCPSQFQPGAPVFGIGEKTPINTCYRQQALDSSGDVVTGGPIQDVRNGQLPASPEWRITVSPRFETDLSSNFRGFIQADLTYQSDEIFALEQDPLSRQDGYPLVDLSMGVRQADGRYSLTFFVKNLFDQNFYTSLGSSALHGSDLTDLDLYANRPKNADRYVGATLGFKF
jgi:iron complex outermembrane receptor protein